MPASRRFWRKGRPAAGFLVGGLCVFGAVMAIRSLAEWAGEEVRPAHVHPVAVAPAGQNSQRPPADQAASAPAMEANAPPERDGAARDAPGGRPDRGGDAAADRHGDRGNAGDGLPPPEAATPTPRSEATAVTKSLPHDRATLGARTAAEKPRAPSNTPRKPAPPSEGPVTVRIVSSPPGAVIRSRNRVLGHTPVAVRLTPGITYQLVFAKAGYVTTIRPFTAEPGKSGNVSVALKKKAATPARFFFRGR